MTLPDRLHRRRLDTPIFADTRHTEIERCGRNDPIRHVGNFLTADLMRDVHYIFRKACLNPTSTNARFWMRSKSACLPSKTESGEQEPTANHTPHGIRDVAARILFGAGGKIRLKSADSIIVTSDAPHNGKFHQPSGRGPCAGLLTATGPRP